MVVVQPFTSLHYILISSKNYSAKSDYCDGGACPVKGASDESKRIAAWIKSNINRIEQIIVTLESHNVS